jgi:hypothetical protein
MEVSGPIKAIFAHEDKPKYLSLFLFLQCAKPRTKTKDEIRTGHLRDTA